MGRSVEIAFLAAGPVRDAFEVIRRTLSPHSRSLPHVTLRHQARPKSRLWGVSSAQDANYVTLTLDGVTTFDGNADGSSLSTVIVRCTSDDLDLRTYKPSFPRSVPHITLYDGPPSGFAAKALRVLSAFPWHRHFATEFDVFSSSREAMEASDSSMRGGVLVTGSAHDMLLELLRELGVDRRTSLLELSDSQRMAIITQAARLIHEATLPADPTPDSALRIAQKAEPGQLAFWSPEEVWAISGERPSDAKRLNRKTGSYATPPELALDVASAVAPLLAEGPIDFGDPAAGNGVLLAAARRVFGAARFRSAQLIELDLSAARLAEQRWARAGADVTQADFLELHPGGGDWSVVLANPPYRRSQLVATETKALRTVLSRQLDISISARSDLYVYFLLRTHAWMREGGVAAWIVPSEFQVTTYGSALRTYLTSYVQLERMHTFDAIDPVFDNALTSTTVLIFRKRRPDLAHAVTVSEGGTLAHPRDSTLMPVSSLRASARWSFSGLRPAPTSAHAETTIGDLFEVRRGIATGANNDFVLNDEDLLRLDVQRRWVRPLLPAARDVPSSRITADGDGVPIPHSGRWLIDTAESLSAIEDESPSFAHYLRVVQERTRDRALVARRRLFTKQEDRPAPPFVFAYMMRSDSPTPRFLRNESCGTYLNNYIGLYFRDSPSVPGRNDAYLDRLLERLLRVDSTELSRQGRLYGKGLLKLEPGDLRRVRVPD